jgi:hypothetical protein
METAADPVTARPTPIENRGLIRLLARIKRARKKYSIVDRTMARSRDLCTLEWLFTVDNSCQDISSTAGMVEGGFILAFHPASHARSRLSITTFLLHTFYTLSRHRNCRINSYLSPFAIRCGGTGECSAQRTWLRTVSNGMDRKSAALRCVSSEPRNMPHASKRVGYLVSKKL